MLTTVKQSLQRATPESQGIASAAILKFVEAVDNQLHELHSFMLLRHGKVVAEGWWSPYSAARPHMLFSLSKSFTSTAIGLAVNEGRLSVDDKVLSFFPDETPAEVNEHLAAMQVRHLLAMSTGHAEDTTNSMVMRADGNWTKGFFEVPVLHAPGTHFLYNTGATYMLAVILQKLTGMSLIDYLTPRLFEPLGIENPTWEISPQLVNVGGWGLNIRTEDIAKFGQLYLQNGMWAGQQLVPEAWVKDATSFQTKNGDDPNNDWSQGYCYQFWRCRHNAYRGDGAFGQYCVVMPDQDTVLAITSGLGDMQPPLNLVWDILLPALQAAPLADDPVAHTALAHKLTSLSIPPMQGKVSSPTVAKVSGKTYKLDANPLNIESITPTFSDSGCTFALKTARGETSITCGYGAWQAGETTLYNEFWRTEPMQIVASGAWTHENSYTTVVRLHETPFYHTVVYRFGDNQLMLESRVNTSFMPLKTEVVSGKAD